GRAGPASRRPDRERARQDPRPAPVAARKGEAMSELAPLEIPRLHGALPRPKLRRAIASLRALLDDPDDTANAIEGNLSIGVLAFERRFRRFAASRAGMALLREQPSLQAALSDGAALERMAPDSLGRAYLDYLARNGFRAAGLLELQNEIQLR